VDFCTCLLYGLKKLNDNQAVIFEYNQVNLNYHVEELANMVENTKPEKLLDAKWI
jgi:hypothetical protein